MDTFLTQLYYFLHTKAATAFSAS